ncbi:MAG: 1-deoxy-D-xylulose-5-phosphate synthase [Phycisphaerae bacterium]|nr:1-deoxy-D-xylulose-5-phosphate synthase [Phycisphaerae bacterium]
MSGTTHYPLLDTIRSPIDLRELPVAELPKLALEIRQRIIEVVSRNGGHLASNLGVAELTIALHYVFDFRQDRLLWDVGHQCYPHKLLTGRHARFDQLRKAGGVSGFPAPSESEYDLFATGHAGTAISTAVGLARADLLTNTLRRVVALVGDASIVNGLAFEGLNQAGLLKRQMLVILNDNQWGISPTQGGMAEYLAKFRVSNIYEDVKQRAKQLLPKLPVVGKSMFNVLNHVKEGIKATVSPHQIFEQMGYIYVGPTDGHDIAHLIELLTALRDVDHPVLLHVHTEKGKGASWACAEPGKFHSPKPFTLRDGKAEIIKGQGKSWTSAFADTLCAKAATDRRIFALTAGMADGTGLSRYQKEYPDRFLDVGIAESCTVDIAAGMAKNGLRPVCAIYSTFLQRALDQVFQEVVLQKLPVMFCIDRAGLVGGDGAVHHGFMDLAYLRSLPGMVLMSPADEAELSAAMELALHLEQPCAIRYPRDNVPDPGYGVSPPFVTGVSRLMREGHDATIIAYGSAVAAVLDAADLLQTQQLSIRVINGRFARPVDLDMLREILVPGHVTLTVEDHSRDGGFGSAVLEAAQDAQLPTNDLHRLGLPADYFIAQGSRSGQLAEAGIDAAGIARQLFDLLSNPTAVPRQQPFATAPRIR